MIAYTFRPSVSAVLLIMMMIVWFSIPGDVAGVTLYQYTDKDGSVVLTDNPPPGVKAKPFHSSDEVIEEKKVEPEKDEGAKTPASQEVEAKKQEKQEKREKIKTLREEVDKAISDEAEYRRNMNQSHGYVQKNYWRKLIDDKLKEIEDKKKQIEELESSP